MCSHAIAVCFFVKNHKFIWNYRKKKPSGKTIARAAQKEASKLAGRKKPATSMSKRKGGRSNGINHQKRTVLKMTNFINEDGSLKEINTEATTVIFEPDDVNEVEESACIDPEFEADLSDILDDENTYDTWNSDDDDIPQIEKDTILEKFSKEIADTVSDFDVLYDHNNLEDNTSTEKDFIELSSISPHSLGKRKRLDSENQEQKPTKLLRYTFSELEENLILLSPRKIRK